MSTSPVLFFVRNDPKKHVVIRNVIRYFTKIKTVKVLELKNLLKDFKQFNFNDFKLVYIDDPVAFLVFHFFFKKKNNNILFHSLEMYEHQLNITSFKTRVRKIFFEKLHHFALVRSDYILFPNEVRKNFYMDKYSDIVSSKVTILENIPYFSNEGVPQVEHKSDPIVKSFVEKHKKTIVFAGAIKEGRDITQIIKLFSEQKDYGLCVISSNTYQPKDIDLKNGPILLLNNLSHQEVLNLYPLFDAGLLYYENEPMNVKYCAPVKIYEYNEFRLRIISNNNYSARQSILCDYVYFENKGILDYLKSVPSLRKDKKHYNFEESLSEALVRLSVVK